MQRCTAASCVLASLSRVTLATRILQRSIQRQASSIRIRLSIMNLDDLATSSGEWLRGSGPESDIVISSRIRLARNLADFPFISRATDADRAEIERILHTQVDALVAAGQGADGLALPARSATWPRSIGSFWSSGSSSAASTPRATAPGPW